MQKTNSGMQNTSQEFSSVTTNKSGILFIVNMATEGHKNEKISILAVKKVQPPLDFVEVTKQSRASICKQTCRKTFHP